MSKPSTRWPSGSWLCLWSSCRHQRRLCRPDTELFCGTGACTGTQCTSGMFQNPWIWKNKVMICMPCYLRTVDSHQTVTSARQGTNWAQSVPHKSGSCVYVLLYICGPRLIPTRKILIPSKFKNIIEHVFLCLIWNLSESKDFHLALFLRIKREAPVIHKIDPVDFGVSTCCRLRFYSIQTSYPPAFVTNWGMKDRISDITAC